MKIYANIVQDPTFKGAFGTSSIFAFFSGTKNKNIKICKESLMSLPQVFYTTRNFFLLDSMNAKVENFKSAGLVGFWLSKYLQKPEKVFDTSEPKKFNLSHFEGIFQILLIGLFVSLLVFSVELVYEKLSSVWRLT